MKRPSPSMLLAGVLSLVLVAVFSASLPAWSQGSQSNATPRTLSVQGQGFVDIPQTIAQVQLGVETQKETAVQAQTDIAQRSSAVVQFLQKNSDVHKLSTAGIRLNPVYETQSDRQIITGYRGANIVRFQIDPVAIGDLLDQAVTAGASQIDGVSLIADDKAIATATDEAIALATQHAERQAKSAIGSLKLNQREVLHIQINGASPRPTNFSQQHLMNDLSTASTTVSPIIAGEQRIAATVTLQIRY